VLWPNHVIRKQVIDGFTDLRISAFHWFICTLENLVVSLRRRIRASRQLRPIEDSRELVGFGNQPAELSSGVYARCGNQLQPVDTLVSLLNDEAKLRDEVRV
jgi:hypothetical protein